MPTITELLAEIKVGLDAQANATEEVRKLRISLRVIMGILGLVLVIALLSGVAALYAHSASDKAQRAVSIGVATNRALIVEACRALNNANVRSRDGLSAQTDAMEHALNEIVTSPTGKANVAQLIKELREAIPLPADQDNDCTIPPNGLGVDDYKSG